ncbi:MAG: serine protease [Chloroflexota bacterium]
MKDQSRHRQQGTAFYLTLLAAAGLLTCVLLAGTCRGQCEGGKCGPTCFTAPSGQFDVLDGRSVANPNWNPQNIRVVPATADPQTIPDFTVQLDGSPDKAVCMVATFNEQLGKWAVGSGTLIGVRDGEGLVMTCVHGANLADGRNFCIFGEGTRPRRVYPGKILEYDSGADVMVLVIPRPPGITPIALSDLNVQDGQRVWTAGYAASNNGGFASDAGNVVGPEPNAQWTDGTIATDAKASQGQSGGPILNQYRRVCGVISGADARGNTLGTSTTHIRKLFPRLRSLITGLPPGPTMVERIRTPQGNMVIRRPMAPVPPANIRARVQPPQVQPMPEDQPPPLPIPADPAMPPDPGPPVVEQPTPAPITELVLRIERLEVEAVKRSEFDGFKADITSAIAAVAKMQGPAGAPGKAGLAGPPGPAGPPYQLSEADMVRIVAAVRASLVDSDGVARNLPPIYVKKSDQGTGKEETIPVFLGEGFTYRLFPESKK